MFRFTVERDQQQHTILKAAVSLSSTLDWQQFSHGQMRTNHQPPPTPAPNQYTRIDTEMQLEFGIHENHEYNVMWAALEHTLKTNFEDIAHTELLPTSGLKTHIFVLSQDKGI